MEAKKNTQVDLHKKKGLFFSIGLVVTCMFIISAFEWKSYTEVAKVDIQNDETFEEMIDIPITQIQEPPKPVIQQPEVVEVPDEEEIDDEIEVNLDVEIKDIVTPAPVIKPKKKTPPKIIEEKEEKIFLISETQAMPKGGISAFYKYIGENLDYPAQARRMSIEGTVVLQFIVEKDGSLTDFKVLKSVGGGCDEEAIRVLKKSPKWSPGKQRGVPVRVRRSIPIRFTLR
ncbi:MAG TPA: energy transducer TonB [Microscillaceae bacterium]|nr:energy transducer TonB [Microscillaceae bacterium]